MHHSLNLEISMFSIIITRIRLSIVKKNRYEKQNKIMFN